MQEFVHATVQLYKDAVAATVFSFARCWLIAVAVVIFGALMIGVQRIAFGFGMLGGFMVGAANALFIGATLSLVEEAVRRPRRLTFEDIWGSFGQYFWDVIGVLFVLWIPIMVLERAMMASPYGLLFTSGVFLLLFILLNPAPEVIYLVRHDSPLDVFRHSYEFVIENWIEWFIPLAVLLAPLGLTFFFDISSVVGRHAGLNFFDLLSLPGTVLTVWLNRLGVPPATGGVLVFVLTPLLAVLILIFRGHLFAALHGSTRRQRLFRAKTLGDE